MPTHITTFQLMIVLECAVFL